MSNVTYLNLPDVPIELLDDIDEIISKGHDPYMPGPIDRPRFQPSKYDLNRSKINDKLLAWLQSVIHKPFIAQYQFMNQDLPVHVDKGAYSIVYTLRTGGQNVSTHFHDDENNITESVVLPTNKWVQLYVHNKHSVHGIEDGQYRVALSVRMNTPLV